MWNLYLDESGCRGFDVSKPGTSKYLTICILAVSQRLACRAIAKAVRHTIRRKLPRGANELKGSSTAISTKLFFYRKVEHELFGIYSVTLNKPRVYPDLCSDPKGKERMYNFTARLILDKIPFERTLDGQVEAVKLTVDASKSKSDRAEFNRYIIQHLQGRVDPRVRLDVSHVRSFEDPMLSAVDLFCWGLHRFREHGDDEWRSRFTSKVRLEETYLADSP